MKNSGLSIKKDSIYKLLTKPFVVVIVMLLAPLFGYLDRNFSFFFGLGIVLLILWSSNFKWSLFGFTKRLTKKTILYSILLTIGLLFLDNFIALFVENYFGPPNYSSLEGIKHNPVNFIIILIIVWTIVAFGEEFLFKGYYYKWLASLFGNTKKAWLFAGIITSIYFGISHSYQGISGVITIAIMTLADSYIFYKNKTNLWLLILIHGLYDTWGLTFLYLDKKSPITLFVESLF